MMMISSWFMMNSMTSPDVHLDGWESMMAMVAVMTMVPMMTVMAMVSVMSMMSVMTMMSMMYRVDPPMSVVSSVPTVSMRVAMATNVTHSTGCWGCSDTSHTVVIPHPCRC